MLASITFSPQGRSFTFNSYQAGLPSSVTDDRGLTVANTLDGLNRLTGAAFPDGTSISNIYSRLDWWPPKTGSTTGRGMIMTGLITARRHQRQQRRHDVQLVRLRFADGDL